MAKDRQATKPAPKKTASKNKAAKPSVAKPSASKPAGKPSAGKNAAPKKAAAKKAGPKKAASKPEPAAARSRLAVLLDGKPLAEDEARTLWQAFSVHMDEHEGDLTGFAAQKGWSSVKPEYRAGQAVLVVTT
ncbi:MAG: hypothetical protein JNL21_06050 [Myxococcales bacterium]|nr:hypothetical protein [Myxococcales bacterium]